MNSYLVKLNYISQLSQMIRKQKQMQTQRVESFLNERNSPILSLCLSSFLLSFSQFDGRGAEGGRRKLAAARR